MYFGANTGITASGRKASGSGNGQSLTHTNTHVDAGQKVVIESGASTTLQGAVVKADGDVVLKAAQNTSSESSSSKSSSASIGVSFGASTGITASASKASGSGNGESLTHTNTHVDAGNKVVIESGADTTLQGAVVSAQQVMASVGSNLKVESLQDTSTYQSQSKSVSGSITVGAGAVSGGSFSANKSSVNSNYQSVTEQSAIRAGDGGFQVNVGGGTTLIGGQITSTQAAIDAAKNAFVSLEGVTTTDIQNSASYSGKSVGVTAGLGKKDENPAGDYNPKGTSFGSGALQGSAQSVSKAAISGVAGEATARTGDAQSGLKPIFDKGKVQAELDARAVITGAFGSQAAKAVGDYAEQKFKQAMESGDQAGMEAWKEGGSARVALHTALGSLTGGVQGAMGAGASQAVIDEIGKQIANADIPDALKKTLVAVAGMAIGAGMGSAPGAAAAFNSTTNNYLTAADLRTREERLRNARARADVVEEIRILSEYERKSASSGGAIDYRSVLSEADLVAKRSELEALLGDSSVSQETKVRAQRSIGEINTAINVLQRAPVLMDAAELGLLITDVAVLGQLAAAKALSANLVKEFVAARTGRAISDDAAAAISNNFYRDGSHPASWTPGPLNDMSLNAADHWHRHAKEFPHLSSQQEYISAASAFINSPPPGTQTFWRTNGDKLLYHAESNTFAIQAPSGMPRTMFKPTDQDAYWLSQTGFRK